MYFAFILGVAKPLFGMYRKTDKLKIAGAWFQWLRHKLNAIDVKGLNKSLNARDRIE